MNSFRRSNHCNVDKSCLEWTISYQMRYEKYLNKLGRSGRSSCSVNFKFIDFYPTKRVSYKKLDLGPQTWSLRQYGLVLIWLIFTFLFTGSILWLKKKYNPGWLLVCLNKIAHGAVACLVCVWIPDTPGVLCSAWCGAFCQCDLSKQNRAVLELRRTVRSPSESAHHPTTTPSLSLTSL